MKGSSSAQTWTHSYVPRSYFKAFHARTQRRALLVVHRQAGKSHAVAHDMIARALYTKKQDWRGAYIAPFLGQAKKAVWKKLVRAVQTFPGVKIGKADLSITFPNGSVISIYGADNAEALRGDTLDYACLDEFGDMHPTVLTQIVGPMLMVRKGHLVIIGTPKGANHFYTRYQKALANPTVWFTQLTTIEDTKEEAISYEEQKERREDMEDPEWNQEFLCSFTAEFRGSYYAKQLEELQARGGLKAIKPDPYAKVEAAMDVGRADATCIWFWQYIGGEVRVIDYFEATGLDAEETCDILELRPYEYSAVWLPHDAFHHTWSSKKSGFDTFISRGIPARRTPKPDAGGRVYHGIDAVRKCLRIYPLVINTELCQRGIDCLRNYSRKYDIKKQVYSDTPNHDQWSHGADAFRYLCLALNPSEIAASRGRITQTKAPALNKPIEIKRPTFDELIRNHDAKIAEQEQNYFRVRN